MNPQAVTLKELLDKPELQVMPGCGDAMGARLIEEARFRIGFISGSSIAAMRLAMPDMDLLTFPEMADAVETCIAAAPKVLWLADGDTGYGNALAVQKAIRAYASGGPAAVRVEDKEAPRPRGRGGAGGGGGGQKPADGERGGTGDGDRRRRLSRRGGARAGSELGRSASA